jgi:hypothetical protein
MSAAVEIHVGDDDNGGEEDEHDSSGIVNDMQHDESDAGPVEHVATSSTSRASAMLGFDPFDEDADGGAAAGPAEEDAFESEQTLQGQHTATLSPFARPSSTLRVHYPHLSSALTGPA